MTIPLQDQDVTQGQFYTGCHSKFKEPSQA